MKPQDQLSEKKTSRLVLQINGLVQGVGFRPYIWHLAEKNNIHGYVKNTSSGLYIDAKGNPEDLLRFENQITIHPPRNARIGKIHKKWVKTNTRENDPINSGFTILQSRGGNPKTSVLPDLCICQDCINEIENSQNRRKDYPFTNCTHCGPRFSIVTSIPYDRKNTTMQSFPMCEKCYEEYTNPSDRRFHAQPIACPRCGPEFKPSTTTPVSKKVSNQSSTRLSGIPEAVALLKQDKIIAVKGIGGYQLLCLPKTDMVERLRRKKGRDAKPFALMFPSLEKIADYCQINQTDSNLLQSPQSPIVLLQKKENPENVGQLPHNIAPDSSTHGCMIPYSPLHHILMQQLGSPVIATSANISGEPLCVDEKDAEKRLHNIADAFLHHNRPIARPVDDSVVTQMAYGTCIFRQARGYAPASLPFLGTLPDVIAYGPHMKNTIALARGTEAIVSQHLGDLDSPESMHYYAKCIDDYLQLFQSQPKFAVCDLHPDYASTKFAMQKGLPLIRVQHHMAHVLSCMAENHLREQVTGLAWDGTGYGTDGTIWGGEFFSAGPGGITREGCFLPFHLPGGEKAVTQPLRCAYAMLHKSFPERRKFDFGLGLNDDQIQIFDKMMAKGLSAPLTSSVGRIFDAVAAILGLCNRISFEGQAAMRLESAALQATGYEILPYDIICGNDPGCKVRYKIDWRPMIRRIWTMKHKGSISTSAKSFHATLADMALQMAIRLKKKKVVFSGGCFQNRLLVELIHNKFIHAGFEPYFHAKVPPNDGGISLGQIQYAAWFGKRGK